MRGIAGVIVALLLSGAVTAATGAAAEAPEGDWLGVMKTSAFGDLTMAVHLRREGGGWAGTVDDITLGARGLAASDIKADGAHLTFQIPAAPGRFEATWDATAAQWAGVWTPVGGTGIALRLARGVAPPAPVVAGLDGDWQGAINVAAAGLLRLVIHVRTGAEGTTATIDSPDQGANGAPISAVRRTGRDIEIDSRIIKATLTGELSEDGGRIQGEFVQGPMIAPIVLTRGGDAPAAPARPLAAAPVGGWRAPADADIRALLVRRIDRERRGVGLVVGVISPAGRRIVAYGAPDLGDPRKVDGDTLFEIGSITKTFTALLLQDMALKGEVGLDDPVARYLPPGTVVASRNGKAIILRELATHTAGLPHDLPNALARRPQDVLAMTGEAELWAFLATYQLPRDPGAEWEYSNLGMGPARHCPQPPGRRRPRDPGCANASPVRWG